MRQEHPQQRRSKEEGERGSVALFPGRHPVENIFQMTANQLSYFIFRIHIEI